MTPLDAYLRQAGVRYFTASELVQRHKGEPPQAIWGRIVATAILADKIRIAWGSAVKVVSGYRSPEYNAKVSGSKKSMHMEFRAMDIAPVNGDIAAFIAVVQKVVTAERATGVNVGLGLYDTFCHVDTNAPTGKNRSWDERGNKGAD